MGDIAMFDMDLSDESTTATLAVLEVSETQIEHPLLDQLGLELALYATNPLVDAAPIDPCHLEE